MHIMELQVHLQKLLLINKNSPRAARPTGNLKWPKFGVEIKIHDVPDTGQWWHGHEFDRILLNASCSSTGVIRRNPDINENSEKNK